MANDTLLPEIHLGVSPLSWTNDVLAELGGDIPLETCLKDAADIGYEGVELGRKFPREGPKLSSILSGYGLRLIGGWHSGYLTERTVEEEWQAAGLETNRAFDLRRQAWRICDQIEGDRDHISLPLSFENGC